MKTIDIAYTVDNRYFRYALVSMASVLKHHREERIAFWVITDGISEDNLNKALSYLDGRAKLHLLTADISKTKYGRSTHVRAKNISEAMYLRLQLPSLLPNHLKRILYLDADTVCTAPGLPFLFSLNLLDYSIAAVRDMSTRRFSDNLGLPLLHDHPELNPQAPYFNSGVLLIDIESWKHKEIEQRCYAYLEKSKHNRRFPDQDALNYVCYNNWFRLNKCWNYLRSSRLDAPLDNRLSETIILHFGSYPKPWEEDFPKGHRLNYFNQFLNEIDQHLSLPYESHR